MKIALYEIQKIDQKTIKKGLFAHKLVIFEAGLNHGNLPPKDTEVLSVHAHSLVDKQVIAALPHLKYVQTRTAGSDHIDIATCKARGITVTYQPGINSTSVAEFVFTLLLAASRNILMAANQIKKGSFAEGGYYGYELEGKTMGIIGTGAVGAKTATIARGFGMNVIAYDVKKNQELIKQYQVKYLPMDQVLRKADVISLHVPLLPSTHHLINKSAIAKMKKGVMVINTARGPVIDTAALVAALKSGRIAAAGLDVLEDELAIRKNQLKKLPATRQKLFREIRDLIGKNLIVTPHIAYSSFESNSRMINTAIEDMYEYAKGKPRHVIK